MSIVLRCDTIQLEQSSAASEGNKPKAKFHVQHNRHGTPIFFKDYDEIFILGFLSTASAHVRCQNIHDYMAIANDLKKFFHDEGIHSTTIQPEFEDDSESPDGCILECGPDKNCAQQTCCGPKQTGDASKPKATTNGSIEGDLKGDGTE